MTWRVKPSSGIVAQIVGASWKYPQVNLWHRLFLYYVKPAGMKRAVMYHNIL